MKSSIPQYGRSLQNPHLVEKLFLQIAAYIATCNFNDGMSMDLVSQIRGNIPLNHF